MEIDESEIAELKKVVNSTNNTQESQMRDPLLRT